MNKLNKFFERIARLFTFFISVSYKLSHKYQNKNQITNAEIVLNLLKNDAKISVTDPAAINNFKNLFGDKIQYFENNFDVLNGANCLIINTEWSVYRQPDFNVIKQRMEDYVIFDGRNLYNPKKLKELGFYYSNVGYSPKDE